MSHKDKHHKEKEKDKEKDKHKDKKKHHHKESKKKHSKEDKKDVDKNKDECQAPDYHKMHMCVLKHMGQMQKYDELSENPTHRCSRCGCSSNNRKNLCQPYEL